VEGGIDEEEGNTTMCLIGRRHETRTDDSRQKGYFSEWIRSHSAVVKTLSRYTLQHNLMVFVYAIVRLYFMTIRIESVNEDAIVRHFENGGKGAFVENSLVIP
jgi:hypothetical protein